MVKALDDLRAIEVGTGEALSLAGRFLAELGVEVIKVEPPKGDYLRSIPPILGENSSYLFEMLNPNKRSVTLDLTKIGDVAALRELVATAEIVLESFPDKPGFMYSIGLGYDSVKQDFPGLIYLTINGFGQNGPYAARPWTDITAQAIMGHMYVGGKETDPPTKTGAAISEYAAAIYGAAGVTAAIYNRDRTGRGQQVEVSAADCIVSLNCTGLLHTYHSDAAGGHIGHPPFVRRGLGHGTAVPYNGYLASDGLWVVIPTFGDPNWVSLCKVMGREELIDDPHFKTNVDRIAHREEVDAIMAEWVAQRPVAEIEKILEEAKVPVGMGATIKEVLENPQFIERGLITTIEGPIGSITVPNSAFRMSKTPGGVEATAPALGEAKVADFLGRKPLDVADPEPQDPSEGPLKGLKVADFTMYVAGAWAPRLLADMGAEVVKVERPAGEPFRYAPPQINGVKGAGGMFNNTNTGKHSISFNMKHPETQAIAKKFCISADVVMENNATGTMHRNGVGYEDMVEERPDMIYLSATGFGVTGPMAHRLAYDANVQAVSGIQSLNGWPGGQPHRAGDSGLDLLGPAADVAATLAAVHYRRRTGEGQYIDIGMSDTGVMTTYSAWPAWFAEGKVLQLYGNRYPFYAPYNGYDASDRMVVIGVTTDEQWKYLVDAMGEKGAFFKGRFLTVAERLANVDEIDSVIKSWVADKTAEEVETICLAHNVPAGKVYTVMENIFDPCFVERAQTVVLYHKHAGPFRAPGTPVKFSGTPSWVHGCGMQEIGEFTGKYLNEWVGMSEEEIQRLKKDGAIC